MEYGINCICLSGRKTLRLHVSQIFPLTILGPIEHCNRWVLYSIEEAGTLHKSVLNKEMRVQLYPWGTGLHLNEGCSHAELYQRNENPLSRLYKGCQGDIL